MWIELEILGPIDIETHKEWLWKGPGGSFLYFLFLIQVKECLILYTPSLLE